MEVCTVYHWKFPTPPLGSHYKTIQPKNPTDSEKHDRE